MEANTGFVARVIRGRANGLRFGSPVDDEEGDFRSDFAEFSRDSDKETAPLFERGIDERDELARVRIGEDFGLVD